MLLPLLVHLSLPEHRFWPATYSKKFEQIHCAFTPSPAPPEKANIPSACKPLDSLVACATTCSDIHTLSVMHAWRCATDLCCAVHCGYQEQCSMQSSAAYAEVIEALLTIVQFTTVKAACTEYLTSLQLSTEHFSSAGADVETHQE